MRIYSHTRIVRGVAGRLAIALISVGPAIAQSTAPARTVAQPTAALPMHLETLSAPRTGAATAPPQPQPGDVLRLAAALEEANRYGFANRAARATSDADRARARLPLKALLPSARVETGVIRTTDPIGAFGTTLRQRRVTQDAFSPAQLNNPDAITNVQSALVIEVPLLNLDGVASARAARAGANAATAAADWTAINTRADVVRAFFGAVFALETANALGLAQDAADAAVRQVEAMVRQGLVTKADALQAGVRAADVTSQQLAARNSALTATHQLGLLLGRANAGPIVLPAALPTTEVVRALAVRDTTSFLAKDGNSVTMRADTRAAHAGVIAATADRSRAVGTLLPRVNSFARYDWNAPSTPFGGRKNWTVGVVASWSIFSGGSELADIATASANVAGARANEDAAMAQGRAEADATRREIVVALQRLDLADRAAEASREAYRLVDKRYTGGLATIAELLSAESSATASVLGQTAARYALIDAMTAHRRALGADPGALSELDTAR